MRQEIDDGRLIPVRQQVNHRRFGDVVKMAIDPAKVKLINAEHAGCRWLVVGILGLVVLEDEAGGLLISDCSVSLPSRNQPLNPNTQFIFLGA